METAVSCDTKELRSYHAWEERAPAQDLELFRKAADHIDAQAAEIERLREALRNLIRGYVNTLELGRDRIKDLGGDCDPIDLMEADDPHLRAARDALFGEPNA